MIQVAREINDRMPSVTASKVQATLAAVHLPKIIAIGMSYKPDTADMRGSPSLEVARLLKKDGYDISCYDPLVAGKGYESLAQVATGADCLAILVEHGVVQKELESNLDEILAAMRTPIILRF